MYWLPSARNYLVRLSLCMEGAPPAHLPLPKLWSTRCVSWSVSQSVSQYVVCYHWFPLPLRMSFNKITVAVQVLCTWLLTKWNGWAVECGDQFGGFKSILLKKLFWCVAVLSCLSFEGLSSSCLSVSQHSQVYTCHTSDCTCTSAHVRIRRGSSC